MEPCPCANSPLPSPIADGIKLYLPLPALSALSGMGQEAFNESHRYLSSLSHVLLPPRISLPPFLPLKLSAHHRRHPQRAEVTVFAALGDVGDGDQRRDAQRQLTRCGWEAALEMLGVKEGQSTLSSAGYLEIHQDAAADVTVRSVSAFICQLAGARARLDPHRYHYSQETLIINHLVRRIPRAQLLRVRVLTSSAEDAAQPSILCPRRKDAQGNEKTAILVTRQQDHAILAMRTMLVNWSDFLSA